MRCPRCGEVNGIHSANCVKGKSRCVYCGEVNGVHSANCPKRKK